MTTELYCSSVHVKLWWFMINEFVAVSSCGLLAVLPAAFVV